MQAGFVANLLKKVGPKTFNLSYKSKCSDIDTTPSL